MTANNQTNKPRRVESEKKNDRTRSNQSAPEERLIKQVWNFPLKRWVKSQTRALAERVIVREGVDLLDLYYKHNGILQYKNTAVSGENFFVTNILTSSIPKSSATLFDVGANVGDYSALLLENIPHAQIFAFEPNPATFRRLLDRFSSTTAIRALDVGLGVARGEIDLYDYSVDEGSIHASVYMDVLTSIHRCKTPTRIRIRIETLNSICHENGIEHLHFLKIDTEGNELAVLEGGNSLVSDRRIDIIQFEFNEMNVISRVFLRDFYNHLPQYAMFRLCEDGLISLGKYDPRYEIFKFQNIVAARKEIAASWTRFFR